MTQALVLIALGTGFTFGMTALLAATVALTLGMWVQNFLEGATIALPLRQCTVKIYAQNPAE